MSQKTSAIRSLLLLSLIQFLFLFSTAQNLLDQLNDTTQVRADQEPAETPTIMAKKWNQFHTKWFTLNLGLSVLVDHNSVNQDANNYQQVGDIKTATEFRMQRITLTGTIPLFKYPWRYLVNLDYNGLDVEGKDFSIIDLHVEIPVGENGGWFTIGKQKEGVGIEYVMPRSQFMFMERGSGAPALIKQRNIGVRYSNSIIKHRVTYTMGIFNDWIATGNKNSFASNPMQVTARVTGLPIYESDRKLLHVGIGYRYSDPSANQMSYKSKPEVNTAPNFISTGDFEANGSNTIMLEGIGVKGPVSIVAEYMQVFVNSQAFSNTQFHYWQIGGSWFITGDNRQYNRQRGNLGKLIPKRAMTFRKGSGPGAFELGMRYTLSDFMEPGIDGGKFGRFTTALSWYPNAHFRFEANYGIGQLERNDLTGHVNIWQFRVQFEL